MAVRLTKQLQAAGCTASSLGRTFTDLTLEKCQTLWKDFQLSNAIKEGAKGFKLDEDDVATPLNNNIRLFMPATHPTVILQPYRAYEDTVQLYRWM